MSFKKIFTFKAGNVEFQGLYPTSLPLPKVKMPELLRVLLHPDQWFYYPIASLFTRFYRRFSKSHAGYPQLYLLWTVIGVVLVLVIIFYLTGGKG
jgi:hypothetical protein